MGKLGGRDMGARVARPRVAVVVGGGAKGKVARAVGDGPWPSVGEERLPAVGTVPKGAQKAVSGDQEEASAPYTEQVHQSRTLTRVTQNSEQTSSQFSIGTTIVRSISHESICSSLCVLCRRETGRECCAGMVGIEGRVWVRNAGGQQVTPRRCEKFRVGAAAAVNRHDRAPGRKVGWLVGWLVENWAVRIGQMEKR